jgi:Flp pilus assembly protein TadD
MRTRRTRAVTGPAVAWALTALLGTSAAHGFDVNAFLPCEPLDPTVKYDDLNDPAAAVHLHTVESNHFSANVEHLKKGQTATNLARDLAFVLRQFPNHHRALNSMAEWQLKNKIPSEDTDIWTADCYFQRAIEFTPNDWIVHFVYGVYLHKAHRLDEAERAYDTAEDHGATGPDYFYNRGLLEVDRGDLEKAQRYADKAYGAGHPLPGLREKLAKARAKQSQQGLSAPKSTPTSNPG